MISIWMINICDTSICRYLSEKGECGSRSQEGDKQILENYQPISLLPIAGKIFERLLYNRIFEPFIENKNKNFIKINQVLDQVIFVLNNSSLSIIKFINLLMIALWSELYFLDISKAFDKV